MTHRESKNRNNKRGHSRSGRSARAGRVDWPVVFCVICMAIVGLLWFLSNRQGGEKLPAEKPLSPPVEQSVSEPALDLELKVADSADNADSELAPELRASKLLEKGEDKLAEQMLRDFPNSELTMTVAAYVHGRRGNFAEKKACYERFLERNPNRADIYCQIAMNAIEKGEYDDIVKYGKKALEINPNIPQVRHEIGSALISLGEYSQAVKELEEEVKISAGTEHVLNSHYLLGQAYVQLEEYEKAKENYEKAIKNNPDKDMLVKSYYGLSRVYARLKQRDKAKEYMALSKLNKNKINEEKTKSESAADYSILLISKEFSRMYAEAINFYQGRGYTKKAGDLFSNAEQVFQQMISLLPAWPTGYRELSLLYTGTNRKLPKAQELAEKAVALEQTGYNYFVLSRVCYANGDRAKAIQAIKQSLELSPGSLMCEQWYEFLEKGN